MHAGPVNHELIIVAQGCQIRTSRFKAVRHQWFLVSDQDWIHARSKHRAELYDVYVDLANREILVDYLVNRARHTELLYKIR